VVLKLFKKLAIINLIGQLFLNPKTFSINISRFKFLRKIKTCFVTFKNNRHFLVLIASTYGKNQYMDWVRLVESRIRFLIQGLEKIPLISLAHINPQGYQEIKERLFF